MDRCPQLIDIPLHLPLPNLCSCCLLLLLNLALHHLVLSTTYPTQPGGTLESQKASKYHHVPHPEAGRSQRSRLARFRSVPFLWVRMPALMLKSASLYLGLGWTRDAAALRGHAHRRTPRPPTADTPSLSGHAHPAPPTRWSAPPSPAPGACPVPAPPPFLPARPCRGI